MASTLLRSSALRGNFFRCAVSTVPAAAGPSGAEGLAVRRTVPLPPSPLCRFLSDTPVDQPPKPLDDKSLHEKVNLLHQSIKVMNVSLDKKYAVFAALQKLTEEKKPHNPFVQWLLQVGIVIFVVFMKQLTVASKEDN